MHFVGVKTVKAKHKKVTRGPKRPRVHYCTYPRGVEKQLGVSSVAVF
jgi:hypothetical protein